MEVIGITGGIATGKTSVCNILTEEYKIPCISTDDLAANLTKSGRVAYHLIVDYFGKQILNEDGEIDRQLLRETVIYNKKMLEALNGIVWPCVFQEMDAVLSSFEKLGHKAVAVESALLVESKSHEFYDHLIVVSCSLDEQIDRVMNRDNQSREDAVAIINKQLSSEEKEKHAGFVIKTDDADNPIEKQIELIYNTLF